MMKGMVSYPQRNRTDTSRLEAFSDGVMAVIITIMVLELRPPHGTTLHDLSLLTPKLLIYLLSFAFISVYWINHHHLFRATKAVNGSIMWANLHLLFWLSLVPAVTAWVGDHPHDAWPAAIYGLSGLLAGAAFFILTKTIIRSDKNDGIVAAVGVDNKGMISVAFYAAGIALAFVNPLLSYAIYALASAKWLIPDRRLVES
jgi:uncharacterized membrane protein